MGEPCSAGQVRALRLGEAAASFVGRPFRLHGRDPVTGLDCVGLVVASLAAVGGQPVAPTGYRLRNLAVDHWLEFAERSGLVPASGLLGPDEVLLVALGYGQHHLMIKAGRDEVIHAHAGLRRVVRHRRDHSNSICARWRVNASEQG
jgi:cell wall-associated NlpC family hydrolase